MLALGKQLFPSLQHSPFEMQGNAEDRTLLSLDVGMVKPRSTRPQSSKQDQPQVISAKVHPGLQHPSQLGGFSPDPFSLKRGSACSDSSIHEPLQQMRLDKSGT
eukprot:1145843-Pelagomonas_calceolata.AAC.11